ncbi:MAG: FAD-dependent oxidoreductase, partial [Candidatus Saccharimonadales bacterium]
MKTRRDFLKALIVGLSAGEYRLAMQAARAATGDAPKGGSKEPKLSEWAGDDPTLGHRFRNGDLPKDFPQQPEKSVDFVIVGGGMGGLTAAHYLKDHDVLLLEQYDALGGQSRGGFFKGLAFSYGAAYVSNVDGIYGKLYEELGIKAEKLPAGD